MYSVSAESSFLGRGGNGVIDSPVPLLESLGRQLPNEPRARLPLAVRLSPRPHTMAGNRDTDEDVDTAAALWTGTAGVKKVEAEAAMSEAIAIANDF